MAVYNPAGQMPYPDPASAGAYANSMQPFQTMQAQVTPTIQANATSGQTAGNSTGLTANPTATPSAPATATTATPATTPAADPMAAFQQYLNSAGYQFRLGEGMDALNAQYAARGTLQSGAAQKAAIQYGQDFASNEFGRYMGYLGNQQGVGLSAASALAGVGQNYANSLGANNANYANAMSGLNSQYAGAVGQGAMNAANINSNTAYANANNTNAMIGGVGSALGGIAGSLAYQPYAGSSFGSGPSWAMSAGY